MAPDPRSPCIIGVARRTWHPADVGPEGAPEPLVMWEEVARAAAADAGRPNLVGQLESVDVVFCQSWQYDNAPSRLAERLGANPRRQRYSGIGGSVPQVLASELGASILAGDLDLGLIVGAEALATVRQLKKAGERPQWSYKPDERRPFPLDVPFHPSEITHAIYEAFLTFALFDNARRAHLGVSLADHQRALGQLLSPLTEVAASSRHAWFPIARTPSEISDPRPDNRMVSFPYTKLMTAIMDVDMAAAVVVASSAKADELGVPADQRIYLRGWGYAQDPNHVAAHPEPWRSPAMRAASQAALGGAGIGIDDVAHMDLYSCFASSVAFALDALGLDTKEFSAPSTGRSVTVTGGLPYHGGPGSNYMTHSLAAMTERLRSDPGSFGLVSGVGMHMVKHAYGLWSTTPGSIVTRDPLEVQRHAESASVPSILEGTEGSASLATYSVLHGRDGFPSSAVAVCDVTEASRCYARFAPDDAEAFAVAEHEEVIGRTVKLCLADDGSTLATF